MSKRKSSLRVTLVLVGAAAVAGCDSPTTGPGGHARRDVYANLEDCRKDWGRPELCEQAPAATTRGSRTATGATHRYHGPWYDDRTAPASGPRPGSRAVDSMRVARSGFGSSARAHSAGG